MNILIYKCIFDILFYKNDNKRLQIEPCLQVGVESDISPAEQICVAVPVSVYPALQAYVPTEPCVTVVGVIVPLVGATGVHGSVVNIKGIVS